MPNPYATLTDSSEFIANYLQTQLTTNKASFTDSNGIAIQDVYYGDVSGLLPRTPALCVIPGPESSMYNGVGGRPVMITFQTFVMVYYGKIRDMQQNIHASLTIAKKIKNFVHADFNLGGNVIDCLCTAIEPGVAVKGGALLDASRLAFRSRTKSALNP